MGEGSRGVLCAALLLALAGCGGSAGSGPLEQQPAPIPDAPVQSPPAAPPPTQPAPSDPPPADPLPLPPTSTDVYAPGFHLALRHSVTVDEVTTYRLKLPITRAGKRLRITFRAGDGELVLERANIGRSFKDTWRPPICEGLAEGQTCSKNGEHYGFIEGPLTPITFDGGKPGFTASARTRVVSDPIEFPVGFREEVYVTFEARGALAASGINLLEQSYAKVGRLADRTDRIGSWAPRPVALMTVEVEGPPGRVAVAIGDSITEGYVKNVQDLTASWAYQAGRSVELTTVNAAVSGDGIANTLANLDEEVFILRGVTDCLVLIGTNDLTDYSASGLTSKLGELYRRLAPFCRVWGGTIPPKDETGGGNADGGSAGWEQMHATRRAVNEWVKGNSHLAGVFDFSPPLTDPARPNYFVPEYTQDGIHPTVLGYQVMSKEAARVLRARP